MTIARENSKQLCPTCDRSLPLRAFRPSMCFPESASSGQCWECRHPRLSIEQRRKLRRRPRSERPRAKERLGRLARVYRSVLFYDPCAYCGDRSDNLDHIFPLFQGGNSHLTNLTASCYTCNAQKGTRSLLEFLLDQEIQCAPSAPLPSSFVEQSRQADQAAIECLLRMRGIDDVIGHKPGLVALYLQGRSLASLNY